MLFQLRYQHYWAVKGVCIPTGLGELVQIEPEFAEDGQFFAIYCGHLGIWVRRNQRESLKVYFRLQTQGTDVVEKVGGRRPVGALMLVSR